MVASPRLRAQQSAKTGKNFTYSKPANIFANTQSLNFTNKRESAAPTLSKAQAPLSS